MNPALIALFLVAALLALLPVWRLRTAGWSRGALVTAWLLYGLGIFMAVRFAAPFRFLLPILVIAYVAPFIVGPERLGRVLRRRGRAVPPPVKDVTPPPPPALTGGRGGDAGEGEADDPAGDEPGG